jgi:uncharacterized repeat protein (TIGR03803 family)
MVALALTTHVSAQTLEVLHTFAGGSDGYNPASGLVMDAKRNLYGTTADGGSGNAGTIFKLSPGANGWKETVIYSFSGADGAEPLAGLILDATGNLYGTTASGGNLHYCRTAGCGEVFRLSRGSTGVWELTALYKFTGNSDGGEPYAGVIFDGAGNLYGTTVASGSYPCSVEFNGCGVIFELTPTVKGPWTETVLHSFTGGSDGENPAASLLMDAAGNLYGTDVNGGSGACTYGCGVAFELSPASNGAWNFTILHSFESLSDGAFPSAPLISDASGNLYGTTVRGGSMCGCGTVFELSPTNDGTWTFTSLHQFGGGLDGGLPLAPVVFDSAGNLYGTTDYGGLKIARGGYCESAQLGCGIVFKLAPVSDRWDITTLYAFDGGPDGGSPTAGLVLDDEGNLYGTTTENITEKGVVFKVTP